MPKPKVAVYWCSACGGCDEAIVDLEERVLAVRELVDFVFWPCAMDFKRSDVEALADGEIAVSLINGAVRTSEQEEMCHLLRRKSAMVVAFGSCACFGGIPALANLSDRASIFERVYGPGPTNVNPDGIVPRVRSCTEHGHELELPAFFETVRKLDDVVKVDHYLPGCSPNGDMVADALGRILSGNLPAPGSVLLPDMALCRSCPRNASKPASLEIQAFRRILHVQADPDTCFLAQGIVCMGPATRDGCGSPCVEGNMPCTGCLGAAGGGDQGMRMVSAMGGILQGETEDQVRTAVGSIPDPAGTFYRYSLSSSLLGSRREEDPS